MVSKKYDISESSDEKSRKDVGVSSKSSSRKSNGKIVKSKNNKIDIAESSSKKDVNKIDVDICEVCMLTDYEYFCVYCGVKACFRCYTVFLSKRLDCVCLKCDRKYDYEVMFMMMGRDFMGCVWKKWYLVKMLRDLDLMNGGGVINELVEVSGKIDYYERLKGIPVKLKCGNEDEEVKVKYHVGSKKVVRKYEELLKLVYCVVIDDEVIVVERGKKSLKNGGMHSKNGEECWCDECAKADPKIGKKKARIESSDNENGEESKEKLKPKGKFRKGKVKKDSSNESDDDSEIKFLKCMQIDKIPLIDEGLDDEYCCDCDDYICCCECKKGPSCGKCDDYILLRYCECARCNKCFRRSDFCHCGKFDKNKGKEKKVTNKSNDKEKKNVVGKKEKKILNNRSGGLKIKNISSVDYGYYDDEKCGECDNYIGECECCEENPICDSCEESILNACDCKRCVKCFRREMYCWCSERNDDKIKIPFVKISSDSENSDCDESCKKCGKDFNICDCVKKPLCKRCVKLISGDCCCERCKTCFRRLMYCYCDKNSVGKKLKKCDGNKNIDNVSCDSNSDSIEDMNKNIVKEGEDEEISLDRKINDVCNVSFNNILNKLKIEKFSKIEEFRCDFVDYVSQQCNVMIDEVVVDLREKYDILKTSLKIENSGNEIVRKCPKCVRVLDGDCKCSGCGFVMCVKCEREIVDKHVCNFEDVESVRLIKCRSKSCPKCGVRVEKVGGCDKMLCVKCFASFNWISGNVILSGEIDNPHGINIDLDRIVRDLVDRDVLNSNLSLLNVDNKVINEVMRLYDFLVYINDVAILAFLGDGIDNVDLMMDFKLGKIGRKKYVESVFNKVGFYHIAMRKVCGGFIEKYIEIFGKIARKCENMIDKKNGLDWGVVEKEIKGVLSFGEVCRIVDRYRNGRNGVKGKVDLIGDYDDLYLLFGMLDDFWKLFYLKIEIVCWVYGMGRYFFDLEYEIFDRNDVGKIYDMKNDYWNCLEDRGEMVDLMKAVFEDDYVCFGNEYYLENGDDLFLDVRGILKGGALRSEIDKYNLRKEKRKDKEDDYKDKKDLKPKAKSKK